MCVEMELSSNRRLGNSIVRLKCWLRCVGWLAWSV